MIQYIHHNSVKRGYVNKAVHSRYFSFRYYEGVDGLIEVEIFETLKFLEIPYLTQSASLKKFENSYI